jgi:hypothetical protein
MDSQGGGGDKEGEKKEPHVPLKSLMFKIFFKFRPTG